MEDASKKNKMVIRTRTLCLASGKNREVFDNVARSARRALSTGILMIGDSSVGKTSLVIRAACRVSAPYRERTPLLCQCRTVRQTRALR